MTIKRKMVSLFPTHAAGKYSATSYLVKLVEKDRLMGKMRSVLSRSYKFNLSHKGKPRHLVFRIIKMKWLKNDVRQYLFCALLSVITICALFANFVFVENLRRSSIVNIAILGAYALVYTFLLPVCIERRKEAILRLLLLEVGAGLFYIFTGAIIANNVNPDLLSERTLFSFILECKYSCMCPILLAEAMFFFALYLKSVKRAQKSRT